MSSMQTNNNNNMVDLAGSPSPLKPMAASFSPPASNHRRILRSEREVKRYAFTTRNDTTDGRKPSAGAAEAAAAGVEVIDLLGDSPPPASIMGNNNNHSNNRQRRTGRKRSRRGLFDSSNDDDDVVEIISPPQGDSGRAAASAAAAASLKQSSPPFSRNINNHTNTNWVDRIREVFPLVSRSRVEKFLAMAASYYSKGNNNGGIDSSKEEDDGVLYMVMSVLSEDPIGNSITEATFAAAAVGGRLESTGEPASTTSSTSPFNSKNNGGSGKRKVAQLECQCCYVEYDFEVMVSCRGGHLFCKTCLQKHTEQRVFGIGNLGVKHSTNSNNKHGGSTFTKNSSSSSKALEILCMTSNCTLGFNEAQLCKALPEKVLKKYNELQFEAVLESANMDDVSKCPQCHFIAVADPALPPMLFHCPQCNFKSCKECGEEYHPNIRCDEVESKNETDGRTKVEEAMTNALIRTCPRPFCRKKFLKNDGCNKMTCSCGAFICYVCRKEIPADVAYKHFCQTPHCQHKTCKLCPLYADTSNADKARMRNAAHTAARSVRKNGTNVDVNAMLKDPPSTTMHNQKRRR